MPLPLSTFDGFSTELLIEIANACSREIDNPAEGFDDVEANTRKVAAMFHAVCAIIDSRGVDISDYVVCPKAQSAWDV